MSRKGGSSELGRMEKGGGAVRWEGGNVGG